MALEVLGTTLGKFKITVVPVAGEVTVPVDGGATPVVVSGDATVAVDDAVPPNPLAFYIISADVAGTAQIRVDVDAQVGAGETIISELINYTYASPQATSLGLSASAELPK